MQQCSSKGLYNIVVVHQCIDYNHGFPDPGIPKDNYYSGINPRFVSSIQGTRFDSILTFSMIIMYICVIVL